MDREATSSLWDPERLSDHEVLALAVGVERDVALRLLDVTAGVGGLRRAGPARLCEVAGIGPVRARRLLASLELGRRVVRDLTRLPRTLDSPAAVARWMTPRIGHLDHEELWVLSLDGRHRLRGQRRVAQGGRHGLVVTAREILAAALSDAASGFLLVHNHPSGSAEPSAADANMTRAVADAAEVVGVPLLDHVVVTAAGGYVSLHERGQVAPAAIAIRAAAVPGEGRPP